MHSSFTIRKSNLSIYVFHGWVRSFVLLDVFIGKKRNVYLLYKLGHIVLFFCALVSYSIKWITTFVGK